MLQQWVPSMGYIPSVVDCSYEGSSPWATLPDRKPAPAWDIHRLKTLHGIIPPAPGWDPLWTAVWIYATMWTSMLWSSPAAGESLLQQPEHLLPLILPWHWCLQDSNIFSLLSSSCCSAVFPFLKCATTEEPPLLLMGLALGSGRSILELAEAAS